jgi:hypothetical protein
MTCIDVERTDRGERYSGREKTMDRLGQSSLGLIEANFSYTLKLEGMGVSHGQL